MSSPSRATQIRILSADLEYAEARRSAAARFSGPAATLYLQVVSARANSFKSRIAALAGHEAPADDAENTPSSPVSGG